MKSTATFLLTIGLASASFAQSAVIMPDDVNNRLVSFDPFDGSLLNTEMFSLAGNQPVQAMQVGNEIWVTEELGNRISRWSMTGNPLGEITGGLQYSYGMAEIGGNVYVCNSGNGTGSLGIGIVEFDTAGNFLNYFDTPASQPLSILNYKGAMLVGSNHQDDDMYVYGLDGTAIGTFHNGSDTNLVEQMAYNMDGKILAACHNGGKIAIMSPDDGSFLTSFGPDTGERGVYQLGNGNILFSDNDGAYVYNPNTFKWNQVYAGSGRYFSLVNPVPEPASFAILGLGAVALFRRRKR
ncbi:MAG: PEP-CTERM sorting domain-containing protein [Armatimonadetes bacterium]|nr:PEP-CTERM sorting domain-containing protein [Armatimonadota bacterium]